MSQLFYVCIVRSGEYISLHQTSVHTTPEQYQRVFGVAHITANRAEAEGMAELLSLEHALPIRNRLPRPSSEVGIIKPTKEQIEEALRQTGGHQVNAAKQLGVPWTSFGRLVKAYGIVVEKSAEAKEAQRQKKAESARQQFKNLSPEAKAARSQKLSTATQRRWEAAEPEELAAHMAHMRDERTPESHERRIASIKQSMTPELRAAHAERTREEWATAPADVRAARIEAVRQGWADQSPEEKAEISAYRKAWFAELPPEQKARVLAAISAQEKRKRRGEVGARPLSTLTKEDLENALQQAGGHQGRAAALVHLSAPSMSRLMKQHGIPATYYQTEEARQKATSAARQLHATQTAEERAEISRRMTAQNKAYWAQQTPAQRVKQGQILHQGYDNLPPEQRAAFDAHRLARSREFWANLTPEERSAFNSTHWDAMTAERLAEVSANKREWFQGLPADEKKRIMAAITSSKGKHKVGGRRSFAAIKVDPLATPEEVQALAEDNPLSALTHPNCPLELWWAIAAAHPAEAEASLLFELMTMEEPSRWGEMEDKNAKDWIITYGSQMSDGDKMRFTLDCAARVLPVFERVYPTDKRPRKAIEETRIVLDAKGRISDLNRDLDRYAADAQAATELAKSRRNALAASPRATLTEIAAAAAYYAAQTAQYAVQGSRSYYEVAKQAAYAAMHGAGSDPDTCTKAYRSEQAWQWRRTLQYLRGKTL